MLFNFQTFGDFLDALLLYLCFSSLFIQPFFCPLPLSPLLLGLQWQTCETSGYCCTGLWGCPILPSLFSLAWMISKGHPSRVRQQRVPSPHLVPVPFLPVKSAFSTPVPWMSALHAFGLHVTSVLSLSSTYMFSSLFSALVDNSSLWPEWP